jgi:hypothetical protein
MGDQMKISTTGVGKLLGGVALAAGMLMAPAANASLVIVFNTGQWFGNVAPSEANMDFAKATFTNNGANTVRLELDFFGNLSGDAKISEWSFNLKDTATISNIVFDEAAGTPNNLAIDPVGTYSVNSFKANGTGGWLDMLIDFHPNGQLTQQAENTKFYFDLTGTGLDEMSFNALSTAGNPARLAAVHIQSYGANNANSLWVGGNCIPPQGSTTCERPDDPTGDPLPEPATLALFGLGLGLMVMRRRKH